MSQDLFLITLDPATLDQWNIPDDAALAVSLPDWQAWSELFETQFPEAEISRSEFEVTAFEERQTDSLSWIWSASVQPQKHDVQPVTGDVQVLFGLFDVVAATIGSFALVSSSGEDDQAFPRSLLEKTI